MFNKYIKRLIYFGITVAFVIAGAWVAGTFNPNDHTVQKIEDEFHKKEMRIIEELGLKEPEFQFSDKTSFINATSTCVSPLHQILFCQMFLFYLVEQIYMVTSKWRTAR